MTLAKYFDTTATNRVLIWKENKKNVETQLTAKKKKAV